MCLESINEVAVGDSDLDFNFFGSLPKFSICDLFATMAGVLDQ